MLRNALGVGLATGAYGVSFGALGTSSGLSWLQTQALSLGMFTGASQFALVGVLGTGGGAAAAVATALMLGLRNTFYGLSLASILPRRGLGRAAGAHLTIDESTAMAVAQPEDRPDLARLAFWATGLSVFVLWNLATAIGAVGAETLGDPQSLGLDAAIPAGFLALLWPRLNSTLHRVVAAAGALVALTLTPVLRPGLPVLAAALIAIGVGLRRP